MRKNTLPIALIAVMILCFMPITDAQSGNDTATAQDVKNETQELINVLQQYTADQRDEAMKKTDQALNKLDGKINELERRVNNNWDKMSQAARQKTKDNLKTLHRQRNELAERYKSFKNSSADAWEQMKKGFSGAYQELRDSWEKARREYDTDTK